MSTALCDEFVKLMRLYDGHDEDMLKHTSYSDPTATVYAKNDTINWGFQQLSLSVKCPDNLDPKKCEDAIQRNEKIESAYGDLMFFFEKKIIKIMPNKPEPYVSIEIVAPFYVFPREKCRIPMTNDLFRYIIGFKNYIKTRVPLVPNPGGIYGDDPKPNIQAFLDSFDIYIRKKQNGGKRLRKRQSERTKKQIRRDASVKTYKRIIHNQLKIKRKGKGRKNVTKKTKRGKIIY